MPKRNASISWPLVILTVALVFLGGVAWMQYQVSRTYHEQLNTAISDLRQTGASGLTEEKTRQEALKLRLENEQRSVFLQALISTISTFTGIFVAILGMWLAFAQYLNSKERERLDRTSKDFENLWAAIGRSDDTHAQASAIAALQSYLSDDKNEYHDRVAAALALVGRMPDKTKLVEETLKPILESAMRAIPESMRRVSWKGLKLQSLDLSGLKLADCDFRDSVLIEADFRNCDLSNARFDAAKLTRASFEGADLRKANFRYSDLADTNFQLAQLQDSTLQHIKLMNANFSQANLQGARFTFADTDWRLSRAWRSAEFSPGLKERLISKYGPPVEGPRILMLLWEYLPNVSGGLWTAAYHLLRNLRSRGADISVAVPHAAKDVSFFEFGNEIPLFPLGGMRPTIANVYTTYEDDAASRSVPITSGYYAYSPYDSILQAASWFAAVASETVENQNLTFDVIHAHDWLTFPAAKAIADLLSCPWVAHFHSTERDRRQEDFSNEIEQIEREACITAHAIVVPSEVTRKRIVDLYDAPNDKIKVVPNCLFDDKSAAKVPPRNRKANKVVFMGRLTRQKGPDLFVEIARRVRIEMNKDADFIMYGDGNMKGYLSGISETSEEGKTIYPDPQKVAPSEKGSPQRFSSPVEIDKIAPAEYDPQTRRTRVYEEKTGDSKEELTEFVLSNGFVAYAIGGYREFTHVIQLEGDLPPNVWKRYAVKATGLSQARYRTVKGRISIVRLPGEVKWINRLTYLHDASLIVVPSRFEPFGMVVLEAMQQGIPVLFSKNAGVAEVIKSGIKIDSEDYEEVANKIVELLEDEAKWREEAEMALKEVTEYPAQAYEKRLMELWSELTKKRSL